MNGLRSAIDRLVDGIREFLIGWLKSFVRVAAQVGKELTQVRRRPGAFISLILGPFLIMALFGLGYTGVSAPLRTIVVLPADTSLPSDATFYQNLSGPAINVQATTTDEHWAQQQLEAQQVDVVVIAPANIEQTVRSGHQATLQVLINDVDPVTASYATFIANDVTQQINAQIVRAVVSRGQAYAVQELGQQPVQIPPDVIASPTVAQVHNLAPIKLDPVRFFAPAVLALVLQHMAVTLTALSFVRERLSGTMDLFRVSPINSIELVVGKYLGLGILSAIIAATTGVLLVTVLGVPLLGSPAVVAAVIALLVFASLGIGMLISVIADSERQAVQLSLLVLLASVFFSGLMLPVDQFAPIVQYAAYLLPVTHGISLLQDLMLRGGTNAWWQLDVLAAIGLVLFVATALILRRQLRSA